MKNNPAAKPNLLVLTSTFPRWEGDVEPGFVFDLCRSLAAVYKITVLAPHARGAKHRETIAGIDVVRFRYGPQSWERIAYDGGIMANLRRNRLLYFLLPLFFVAQWLCLLGCLRRIRPDAVHAHWIVPQGFVLAAALAFRKERPHVVCTAHGSDVSALRGRFWAWLRRWVAARCDRVVAVSEALRERLLADGCPAENLAVIPMGVDLHDLFHPDSRPCRPAEVLFVVRLVPGKGADILLRAFPEILARHPEARLTIVGSGPELVNLADLARRLQVSQSMGFVGALAHSTLVEYYRRATLLVLPSREEGFGLVLAEAMGCGCPVVASDLPAIRAIVRDGETGRLFPIDDPVALASAVSDLLANDRARRDMAKKGRLHVMAHYDWHHIAQRYAAALMSTVQEAA